ncbi:E-selectin-like [Trichomycterus rosablanca]|uniref:E-selectin-like n=1 Tax=Trichomycterus rosablanca TaxID=2290929 RepID=UPI002F35290E
MPFFCYSEVIVIEEKKTWDEAQKHCRTYYTDLFSVTTQTDLLVVNDIRLNITSSFWTGLRFLAGSWFWVNEEEFVGSQVSLPSCPNRPFFCGARKAGANTCENRDCREKMYFACYRQGSE